MGKMNGLFEHWFIRGTIGFILYLLGGWSKSLEIMMTFIIVDYISGYLKSIYKKEISSKKAFRGIIKKASCILAVIIFKFQYDNTLREEKQDLSKHDKNLNSNMIIL